MEAEIYGKRFKSDPVTARVLQVEDLGHNQMDQDPPADHPAFGIDLIVDQIFIKLQVRDLINCSRVNRYWNYRARTVLHDREICLAQISGESPCEQLKLLDQILENSASALPYNGLSITVIKSHKCIRRKPVAILYKNVLEKITLKNLKIYWAKDIPCPCVSFIKTVSKEHVGNLERLALSRLPYGEQSLCEHFQIDPNRPHWLPRLKELRIPSRKSYREGNVERSQIFEIISAAPNLQNIDGVILPGEVQFFLSKKKLHAVKEFEFCYGPGMSDMLTDFAVAHPLLNKLYVTNPMRVVLPWENEQAIVRALNSFLIDSQRTLEELTVDGTIFILQYHMEIPGLSRLKTLCGVEKARRGDFPYFAEASKLNFGVTFPMLQNVEVDEGFLNLLVRFSDALYHGFESQYGCPTVQSIRISGNFPEERRALEILSALFPNVTSFRKTRCSNLTAYFTYLPSTWPALQSISFEDIHAIHWRSLKNASVCGLSNEEMEVLGNKDSDFLANYQFASTQPSISSMSELHSLKAEVLYWRDGADAEVDPETFPTRAMNSLVFDRLKPKLTLQVKHRSFLWI